MFTHRPNIKHYQSFSKLVFPFSQLHYTFVISPRICPTGICSGDVDIDMGNARKIRTFVLCLYGERKTARIRPNFIQELFGFVHRSQSVALYIPRSNFLVYLDVRRKSLREIQFVSGDVDRYLFR